MAATIGHDAILKNLKIYLQVRGRHDLVRKLEGICNGASLLLMVNAYEAMDEFYRKDSQTETLEEKVNPAINTYFQRIEQIANYPNLEGNDHPSIKHKRKIRDSRAYISAQQKLNEAIDQRKIDLKNIDKGKPRHDELLRVAQSNGILTQEETILLKEGEIPNIPLFEDFLNEVVFLQFSHDYLDDMPQNAFHEIFPMLYPNDGKDHPPAPTSEIAYSLVLPPEVLVKRVHKLFPDNSLVRLNVPGHIICCLRIGGQYQFYDINNNERTPLCDSPEILLCLLGKHDLRLKKSELQKDFFNKMQEIAEIQQRINKMDLLQEELIAEKNLERRMLLVEKNNDIFSKNLGFSAEIFIHPSQPKVQSDSLDIDIPKEYLNAEDYYKETALWKACDEGNLIFINKLLAAGADPKIRRFDGVSALYIASQVGNTEVLQTLLDHGVNVDFPNEDGRTALYAAAMRNDPKIAKWLIDHKANLNLGYRDKEGDLTTPFMVACHKGSLDVAKLLFKEKAVVNVTEDQMNAYARACSGGHPSIVSFLIESKFDVNQIGPPNKSTPLIYAAGMGEVIILQMLLNNGADINYQAEEGSTALHVAIMEGQFSIVECLLKKGVDQTIVNDLGNTALHTACESGSLAIVEELLKFNFDLNAHNVQGVTPFILACNCGHEEIVKLLLPKLNSQQINEVVPGIGSALEIAITQGKTEIVKLLCAAGVNVNPLHIADKPPLHLAIERGQAEMAFTLLQHGACCKGIPKEFELADAEKFAAANTGFKTIKLNLSDEQNILNYIIKNIPDVILKGSSQAEKVGLLFNSMIPYKAMTLFEQSTSVNKEARLIRDTLLNPQNKNWTAEQIADCILSNYPKEPDKTFKFYDRLADIVLLSNLPEDYEPTIKARPSIFE